MRRPLNNVIDISSTKKPYVTDDFNEMKTSITNKEVEDKGGTTKHSEFEKPYRLNWEQGYMDMQTQHPSNFSFPYAQPQKADTPQANKSTPIGEPPLSQDILSCLHFNSLCFCIACSSAINPFNGFDCNQKMDDGCQQLVCDSPEECPPFTLNSGDSGDSAPTTLCPSADICAIDIQGGSVDGKCVKVPDEGCGTKNVCITDICGKQVCKEVRMSTGLWVLISNVDRTCSGCDAGSITCETNNGKSKTVSSDSCCNLDCDQGSQCGLTCDTGIRRAFTWNIKSYEWRCP